jgi:hypothetical protein
MLLIDTLSSATEFGLRIKLAELIASLLVGQHDVLLNFVQKLYPGRAKKRRRFHASLNGPILFYDSTRRQRLS